MTWLTEIFAILRWSETKLGVAPWYVCLWLVVIDNRPSQSRICRAGFGEVMCSSTLRTIPATPHDYGSHFALCPDSTILCGSHRGLGSGGSKAARVDWLQECPCSTPKDILWSHHHPDTKSKTLPKSKITSIVDEYRFTNSQQSISKPNPATHKKDHMLEPIWIHLRVKRMVQHTQINVIYHIIKKKRLQPLIISE